jgi:hypothetical protein
MYEGTQFKGLFCDSPEYPTADKWQQRDVEKGSEKVSDVGAEN